MEFKYQETKSEMVAALYEYNNSSLHCLCIRTEDPRKWVWMYPDGTINVQSVGFGDAGSYPLKKFYAGDEITIKF